MITKPGTSYVLLHHDCFNVLIDIDIDLVAFIPTRRHASV